MNGKLLLVASLTTLIAGCGPSNNETPTTHHDEPNYRIPLTDPLDHRFNEKQDYKMRKCDIEYIEIRNSFLHQPFGETSDLLEIDKPLTPK